LFTAEEFYGIYRTFFGDPSLAISLVGSFLNNLDFLRDPLTPFVASIYDHKCNRSEGEHY